MKIEITWKWGERFNGR